MEPSHELQSLARLLLYGSAETRQRMAARLRENGGAAWWPLLASTVRSSGSWLLRARCLELLGLAAGSGDRSTAEVILRLMQAAIPERSSAEQASSADGGGE